MAVKFTPANLRTITQHGELACLKAIYRNRVIGEGGNTIGGGDTRLGDNLCNAGEKIVARDGIVLKDRKDLDRW